MKYKENLFNSYIFLKIQLGSYIFFTYNKIIDKILIFSIIYMCTVAYTSINLSISPYFSFKRKYALKNQVWS